MSTTHVARIETLNKENYDTWKMQMEALLIKNDAWVYVSGECKKPVVGGTDSTPNEAVLNWVKNDNKAKSDIILAINPSELKQIKGCVTSRDVWLKLESIYQSKGPARKATLLKQLTLQRMGESGDVREHINKFFDAVDKLSEMEVEINPDLLAIMLLYSLPSSFENFRCAIESRDDLPTPEVLRIKIVEEFEARKNETRGNVQDALLAKRKTYLGKSQYRKTSGSGVRRNYARDTANEGDGSAGSGSTGSRLQFKCNRCRKVGHKAADCYWRGKTAFTANEANRSENVSLTCDQSLCASQNFGNLNWCIDSGATSHVCNSEDSFISLKEQYNQQLKLADSSSTGILGTGTATFVTEAFGETKNISLSNTLYDLHNKKAKCLQSEQGEVGSEKQRRSLYELF